MPANTQKIRDAINLIRAEMEKDPAIRKEVQKNFIRVLRDRGGLNLNEIIEAHEWCSGTSRSCPPGVTLTKPPD